MSEPAIRADGQAVALEALNEVLEAWLEFAGNKQSRQFLRALSARMAAPIPAESRVIPIRTPPVPASDPATALAAKVWLEKQLPGWLSRYG